jgi:hypothetical protein
MRVSRRIRPSQVGCAASASRRRLQAASQTSASDTPPPRSLPRPSLVIHPDGLILLADEELEATPVGAGYDDADAVAVASARG